MGRKPAIRTFGKTWNSGPGKGCTRRFYERGSLVLTRLCGRLQRAAAPRNQTRAVVARLPAMTGIWIHHRRGARRARCGDPACLENQEEAQAYSDQHAHSIAQRSGITWGICSKKIAPGRYLDHGGPRPLWPLQQDRHATPVPKTGTDAPHLNEYTRDPGKIQETPQPSSGRLLICCFAPSQPTTLLEGGISSVICRLRATPPTPIATVRGPQGVLR